VRGRAGERRRMPRSTPFAGERGAGVRLLSTRPGGRPPHATHAPDSLSSAVGGAHPTCATDRSTRAVGPSGPAAAYPWGLDVLSYRCPPGNRFHPIGLVASHGRGAPVGRGPRARPAPPVPPEAGRGPGRRRPRARARPTGRAGPDRGARRAGPPAAPASGGPGPPVPARAPAGPRRRSSRPPGSHNRARTDPPDGPLG